VVQANRNEEITGRLTNEDQFREAVSQHLLEEVYETDGEEAEAATTP
jgi:lipopolysaccharide biosynthesis regulator YciM